jgi:hypothetical protein
MPTIDERARHRLYLAAERVLGEEQANTLMSLLPPVGWADVATKDDLRQLEARLDARFDARLDRALREQTRTLMLGLVGALATMTSLCLGAVALMR